MAKKICRTENTHGLLLCTKTPPDLVPDLILAAPYLNVELAGQLQRETWLLILDTRDAALENYFHTAGTNGQAAERHNHYEGPVTVQAWIVSPVGQIRGGAHGL